MSNSYSEYLNSLRSSLRELPDDRAADILNEIASHLEESIQELTNMGLSRADAEAQALRRLGDVGKVAGWYLDAHRPPSIWRAGLRPLLMLILCVNAFPLLVLLGVPFGVTFPWLRIDILFWVTMGGFLLLIVACYRSGRFTSGVIALGSFAYCLLIFSYVCVLHIPAATQNGYLPFSGQVDRYSIPRWQVSQHLVGIAEHKQAAEKRLALLQKGHQEFASLTPTEKGIELFQTAKGFKIPQDLREPNPRYIAYGTELKPIVKTWMEARGHWREELTTVSISGDPDVYYLTEAKDEISLAERNLKELPVAATRPFTAHIGTFSGIFLYMFPTILTWGVLCDLIGGLARMLVMGIKKRRRGRGPTLA